MTRTAGSSGRREVRIAALAAGVAFGLAACSPSSSPTSPPSTALATLAAPTPGATTASASGAATPVTSGEVAVDSTLLRVLPDSVDGIAVVESPDGEQEALADPGLAKVATAFASGIALDPKTNEFVYAVVVRLIPGAMGDTGFRDWRDSFDEGACSQANGVAGHAETTIDGRTVFVGTCGGGVRTYHVRIEGSDLLVSASAVGEQRRLGEKLVESLRP